MNPVGRSAEVMKALQALGKTAAHDGLPAVTCYLAHLRASQINGRSVCVDMHSKELTQAGDDDQRIFAVAAWWETPWFTDAEQAAFVLTEELT